MAEEQKTTPPGYTPVPAQMSQYPPQVGASGYNPAPMQMPYGQQQSSSSVVVVGQQPMMGEQHIEVGVKPSNYLAFSIVNMLCCCFILGVIALVYSLQVDSNWNTRSYEESRSSSNTAKVLNIVGFAIGIVSWVIGGIVIVIYIIYIAVIAATIASADSTASSYDYNSNSYSYSG